MSNLEPFLKTGVILANYIFSGKLPHSRGRIGLVSIEVPRQKRERHSPGRPTGVPKGTNVEGLERP